MKTKNIKKNDLLYCEVDIGYLPPTKAKTLLENQKKLIKECFPENTLLIVPVRDRNKSIEITVIKKG